MNSDADIPIIDVNYRGQTWLPRQDFTNLGLEWKYYEINRPDEIDFLDQYTTALWVTLDPSGDYVWEITEKSIFNDEPNNDNPKYNDPKYRVSGYTYTIKDIKNIDKDEPLMENSLPCGPLYVFSELLFGHSRYISEHDLLLCDPILVLDEDDNYGYLVRSDNVYPWRDIVVQKLNENGETWDDILASNPPMGSWLDFNFAHGYDYMGTAPAFMLWTANNVYFSVEHDYGVYIISVPRNPSDRPLKYHL